MLESSVIPSPIKGSLIIFHRYYSYSLVLLASVALILLWSTRYGVAASCGVDKLDLLIYPMQLICRAGWQWFALQAFPMVVGLGVFLFPVVRIMILIRWCVFAIKSYQPTQLVVLKHRGYGLLLLCLPLLSLGIYLLIAVYGM